jgi:hypothetical protein
MKRVLCLQFFLESSIENRHDSLPGLSDYHNQNEKISLWYLRVNNPYLRVMSMIYLDLRDKSMTQFYFRDI